MRGYYDISLSDVVALQSLPIAWVWAWMDGKKRQHEAEMHFRANLLAAIMIAGGVPVDPRDLYPEHKDFDEKIRRLMHDG